MSSAVESHNQQLDFLGDAVLELISTHHLFCLLPANDEGVLTDARVGVINNHSFASFATRLGLHAFAILGERAPSGMPWRAEPGAYEKLLADTFQAFFGAIYLDRGLGPCRNLFAQVLFSRRSELPLRRCWLQVAEQPYEEPDPAERSLDDPEQTALLQFESSTSIVFRRFGLLRQAFTHQSYFTNHPASTVFFPSEREGKGPHNQRLEFLGDALLKLASTDYLYHQFPEQQENQLSVLRSSLVNNSLLCDVAATCGMHHCMRFFQDEALEPGRTRRKMLADCFEAFLGALFLDRQPLGMAHAKAFTHTMLFSIAREAVAERRWMDPKTRLLFCLQEFNAQEALEAR